jgi:predicted RNase H-like nuclease (RuvC/YqgF family)
VTGNSGSEKKWMQFKIDFTSAHREFRLTNQTAQQSGFHSANMMIEQEREETMQGTVDAIVKLPTTMAFNIRTVASLTTTNDNLDAQLETSQAYTKKLNEEISDLKAKIKPTWQEQRLTKSTRNDNY